MGFIRGEVQHEDLPAVLRVVEAEPHESVVDGEIIELEWDKFREVSAEQLKALGKWFVEQAERISGEFDETGKRRDRAGDRCTDGKE